MREVRLTNAQYRRFAWVAAIALLLLLVPKPSLAQSVGTILGTVKDSSGAVVPQAKVTIVNTDTNDTRTANSTDDGSFRFPALLPGHYSVRVEKEGFKTETQTGLNVEVTQEVVVNSVLEVGTSTQEVTVTGEAPLVNTTNSSLGGMVNEEKMADLPLNGRNFEDLTFLQPGVTVSSNMQGSQQAGGLHGSWFVSDGAQIRQNLYTLDGDILAASRGGGPGGELGTTLGVAGIKEYKVVTGTYDASYGYAAGAQVVMVSKGGSNQLHGEVFEYLRNDVLDAANFFDKSVAANNFARIPLFQRNNFGASAGGPIKKDKVFVFGAYEGLRQRLGLTIIDTVPGAGCHGAAGAVITSTACPQLGVGAPPVTIAPVMAGNGVAGSTGILGLFPVPNLPNNQCTFPSTSPSHVDWGQIRVDVNISSSDTLFGRYTTDKSYANKQSFSTTPNGVAFPQFAELFESYEQAATISENHIFSPTVLNQFRLAYGRNPYWDYGAWPQGEANLTGPAYSDVAGYPVGAVTISGLSAWGPPGSVPQYGIPNYYTITDDLYYTKGRHSLRFGTNLTRVNFSDGAQGGDALASMSFTSLANFLQGVTSSYSGPINPPRWQRSPLTYNWYVLGWYGQDDWRVLPRLTLNLGLRYEFMTAPTQSGVNFNIVNRFADASLTVGKDFAPFPKNDVSPRIGFAWDVQGNGKTSVRGGFGRYYDFNFTNIFMDDTGNLPPYEGTRTVTGGTSVSSPVKLPLAFPFGGLFPLSGGDYYEKNPYVLKWNLAVERQLPVGLGLQVGYVGSRGEHMTQIIDGNATLPTAVVNGIPYWNGAEPRQNQNWSYYSMATTTGRSWYNALQVAVNKHLSNGIQLQTSYTWSRLLDNAADAYGGDCSGASGMSSADYFGPGNLAFVKGPACADVANNLRVNFLYQVPNIKSDNFAAKLEHGWRTGVIWSAQTGYPFTPVLSTNRSQSQILGTQGDWANVATSADVAYCAANPSACKYTPVAFNQSTVITGSPNQWFNPNMFTMAPMVTAPGSATVCTSSPCYGTLGNASKGLLRGPGLDNVDFSITKDTHLPFLGEQGNLQFRAELFNIFNHPNFGMPNGTTFTGSTKDFSPYSEAPSSSGPVITATSTTSRQIQLALKIAF